MQYRTTKNYQSGAFLGPRIGDKILISLLLMTLYLNIGKGNRSGSSSSCSCGSWPAIALCMSWPFMAILQLPCRYACLIVSYTHPLCLP